MGNFLDIKGIYRRRQWSDLAEIRTCPTLLPAKYKKDQIKNNREKVETPFSPL